jgi:glycosyltransferase involved in cell wall biosynthesis
VSSTAERPSLSGVVICFNEEDRIERCLQSLSFCDEIVVVDSGSTDRTREIAARYATRLIEQDFLGYVKQKNFAIESASGEWIVSLDADEAISPDLQREIVQAVSEAPADMAGFVLDRITYFLGVWHDAGEWYPDRQLRVFRRGKGRFVGRDPHDRVEVDGASRTLRAKIWHWNYRNLSEHIATLDRFSTRQAQGMAEEGVRFRLVDLLARPLIRFVRGYVFRDGFTKGLPGLMVSISTAYYVFMKYAKLWEIERERADRR